MKVIQKLHKEHITSSMSVAEAQSKCLCRELYTLINFICTTLRPVGLEIFISNFCSAIKI